jgi:hypothetical protein
LFDRPKGAVFAQGGRLTGALAIAFAASQVGGNAGLQFGCRIGAPPNR